MEYVVRTSRLELIAGTADTVRAEMLDRALLAELLNAQIPAEWPPDLNDLKIKELSIRWFEEHPSDRGWLCWYFIELEPRRTLIGIGGFSDVPTAEGTVEAGYSLLPEYQHRGYATEALQALVRWAFHHEEVLRVVAEVPPGHETSARVLVRAGFTPCHNDPDTGVVRYVIEKQ